MFNSLLGGDRRSTTRLVIGLNQVDKMCRDGWNERLNAPTAEAEREIDRRGKDIIRKLSRYTRLSASNIEYYSALKRYRLLPLLGKIIRHAYAGFRLDQIEPADPFELADADVQEFVRRERGKRSAERPPGGAASGLFFDELRKILTPREFSELEQKFKQEQRRAPQVAVLGKAGVGKTTTINNVFNARWKTSHTLVGTTRAQMKEFELASGGTLTVIDLPGYGRSLAEDREYDKIYREVIPASDLILLIMQADARDMADDQEMVLKVTEWLGEHPSPRR